MPDKTEQAQATTGPKKPKTFLMVGSLLLVEALIIGGGMMAFLRPPAESSADTALADVALTDEQKIVEILVLDSKLPNAKAGVTYLYDTEVFVQVRTLHELAVQAELDQFYNEIKAELGAIWRTSDPRHFQEPKLENLTRKVQAMLDERFGTDEDGEPILQKCVIVMGTGFRVDS